MAMSFKQVLIDAELVRQNPLANPLSNTAEFLTDLRREWTGSAFGIDETDIVPEDIAMTFDLGVRWLEEFYGKTEAEAKTQIVRWLLGYSDAQIPGFLNVLGNYDGFPPKYAIHAVPVDGVVLQAGTGTDFGDGIYFTINLTNVASEDGYEGVTTLASFEALSLSVQWEIIVDAFSDPGHFHYIDNPDDEAIDPATCGTGNSVLTSNNDSSLLYTTEAPVFFPDGDKYICVLIAPDNHGSYILYNSDYPEGKILASGLIFNTNGRACQNFTANIEATGKGLTLEELASVPRLTKYFNGVGPTGLSATKKHFIRVI